MSRLKLEPKYITDAQGVKTAVVLDIKQFERLLARLDEIEDVEYIKSVQNEPAEDYQDYRKRRLKGIP